MPFLVRKLNKRDALCQKYSKKMDVRDMVADVPTSEFKTKDGTLSTWYIQDLKELGKAELAIAVTSTRIEKMDFIIINTSILDQQGLVYVQSYPGQDIVIPELQKLHYDITGITLSRLSACAEVYQKIILDDNDAGTYVVRSTASQIKQLLKKAMEENKVNINLAATKEIKETIQKLKKSIA